MPFHPAADGDVHPVPVAGVVACRCCPGGLSRGARARRYPSDIKLVTWAASKLKPKLTLEIVRRPGDLHTFQALPRQWVVERTLSWITRHRRTGPRL